MSEPDQDEMRRKRLARLSQPGGGEKSKQTQVGWLQYIFYFCNNVG